jgi:hypothetical protein
MRQPMTELRGSTIAKLHINGRPLTAHKRFKAISSLRHIRCLESVDSVEGMTETPEGESNTAPEPNTDPATEPTTVVTSAAPAETPHSAPGSGQPRARWRWPHSTRNRIAASVGIAAAAVAIVAGVFTGGVVAGEHIGDGVGGHTRWGNHSQMSADREQSPIGEIWIFPDGVPAAGHDGFIVAGSETSLYPGR